MVTPACLLKLGSFWILLYADGFGSRWLAAISRCAVHVTNEVVFFSDRYSQQDLQPQGYEVTISENGATAIITGFPPVD